MARTAASQTVNERIMASDTITLGGAGYSYREGNRAEQGGGTP